VQRLSTRVALLGRSVAAAFVLAVSTVVGFAAAVLALLPAALRSGPEGRRVATIGRPPPVSEPERPEPAEHALPR
jgi:hypothetical protein